MNWEELLNLRAWTPLAEINGVGVLDFEGAVRISPEAYLRTLGYNQDLDEDDPRVPFISTALWTANIDSLRRRINGDPLYGNSVPEALPPAELLMGTCGTYSELEREGKKRGLAVTERAIYSSQGTFLFRVLDVGAMSYFFLSYQDMEGERPSVVEVMLDE